MEAINKRRIEIDQREAIGHSSLSEKQSGNSSFSEKQSGIRRLARSYQEGID
jgi:hypothetical protein